ncbi:hypothetical protein [Rhodoferax mekongensis]|uniref:hypothetical protein n=1 Tax=Rhodoferax mekongensis TaxID=3068341 RepID=UPI0028BD1A5B|nr:hypothetical protein [Rhodoferax sp. TBRC 17199]MDT7515672.1 hypothetical protein [Rhodoferax sp. TBRC 17199]MDT7517068.1 hypothetical protein [Rhodoferax sp. TBRC 17199]
MSSRVRSRLLGCLALTLSLPAFSGPMGFKDSWMLMGDFSPNWQESFANYALTPRDAIGASTLYMRSDDESKSRQLVDATYTRLVKRWNLPDAQANVWFLGGLGNVTGNDFSGSKAMASPGIQVDYETTRIYVSATARLYRADGINHDYASARLGFSLYEVDYDETQPWLIVEARRMNGLSDKTEVTPMLRLIHNRYFVELGVNNSSQGRINFMYIF